MLRDVVVEALIAAFEQSVIRTHWSAILRNVRDEGKKEEINGGEHWRVITSIDALACLVDTQGKELLHISAPKRNQSEKETCQIPKISGTTWNCVVA